MTDARTIATVTGYDEMIAALRARKAELAISNETLDRLVGWADGYAGKVLGDTQSRRLGPLTLWQAFAALGLGVKLVEVTTADELATRFGDKIVGRNGLQAREANRLAKLGRRAINRAFPQVMQEMQKRAGKARMASMTKRQLRQHQRRAGKARWRKKLPAAFVNGAHRPRKPVAVPQPIADGLVAKHPCEQQR